MSASVSTLHPLYVPTLDGAGVPNGVGSFTPEESRRYAQYIRGNAAGVVKYGDLLVSALPTPGNMVRVAPGAFWTTGTESANQGVYLCILASQSDLDVSAAHLTLDRPDIVAGYVIDKDYSGSPTPPYIGRVEAIPGTPGSGTYPAAPNNAVVLAQYTVPHAATTVVTNGNITNVAQVAAFRQQTLELGQIPGIFARLAASQTDAASNTAGDLVISMRKLAADASLTEALRIRANGGMVSASPYYADAYLNSVQNMPNGFVFTKVNYDAELRDLNNNFDTSTHLYTCPETGMYEVKSYHILNNSAAGGMTLEVWRNGVSTKRLGSVYSVSFPDAQGSAEVLCTAGDTLGVYLAHTMATTPIPLSTGSAQAWVQFRYLGK